MGDRSEGDKTLVVHEMHWVIGERAEEFESLYRDEYEPALAGSDARLLYFFDHPDLGDAYVAVTMTEVADGAAFDHLNQRLLDGDLADFTLRADALRRRSYGTLLRPLIPTRDLAPSAEEGGARLFRHDVVYSRRPRVDELEGYRRGFEAGFTDGALEGVGLFEPIAGWLGDATAVVLYAFASFDEWASAWSDDASEATWSGELTSAFSAGDGHSERRTLRPTSWSPYR